VPANDDAIKSVALIVKAISSAIEEGYKEYGKAAEKMERQREKEAQIAAEEAAKEVERLAREAEKKFKEIVKVEDEVIKPEKVEDAEKSEEKPLKKVREKKPTKK